MKNEFNKQDKALERQQRDYEKKLLLNYSLALKEVRNSLAKLYEQTDGDFSEANKYKRLANLEKSIGQEIAKLTGKNASTLKAGLGAMYAESFYRTSFIIHGQARKTGIELKFGLLNPNTIERAVENPLDRVGFLKRNRDNQAILTRQLNEKITQGLIQGKSYQKVAKDVKERFNIAAYKAKRIVQTEAHRCQQQGRLDSLKESSDMGVVMKKQWQSTLDDRTRDSHQDLDGQQVGIEEEFEINGNRGLYPGGFGVPEEDINCRCTTIGVIEGYEPDLRKARDEDNKSTLVPYQNYHDWKASL